MSATSYQARNTLPSDAGEEDQHQTKPTLPPQKSTPLNEFWAKRLRQYQRYSRHLEEGKDLSQLDLQNASLIQGHMLRAAALIAPVEKSPEEEEAWDPKWSETRGSFTGFLNTHFHKNVRQWTNLLSKEEEATFWAKENGLLSVQQDNSCSSQAKPGSSRSEAEKAQATTTAPRTPEGVHSEGPSTIPAAPTLTAVHVQAQRGLDQHRNLDDRPLPQTSSGVRTHSGDKTYNLSSRPRSAKSGEHSLASDRQHEWVIFDKSREIMHQFTLDEAGQNDNVSDKGSHDHQDEAHQEVATIMTTEQSSCPTPLATSQQRGRSVDAPMVGKQPDGFFLEALRAVQQPRPWDRAGPSSGAWITKALKDIDRAEKKKSESASRNPRDRTADEAMRCYERENAEEAAEARADADDAEFQTAVGKALDRLQRAQMKGKARARD